MLNERKEHILQLLKKERRLSVKRLAAQCFVSEMTIRRDLKEMEAEGYVKRYNGGAMVVDSGAFFPVDSRMFIHSEAKKELAARIRPYLHDGLTVFIDSSSTCSYVVPLLAEYHDVRVVTNSVQSLLLAAQLHLPCIVPGGEYNEHDMCLVGSETERFLSELNVDVGFFSTRGISADGIISDSDARQTAARRAMLAHTGAAVFLFDQTKQNRKFLYTLCRAENAAQVIVL